MKRALSVLLILVFCCVTAGCVSFDRKDGQGDPTAQPSSAPAPTETPAALPTEAPTAEPTPEPTATMLINEKIASMTMEEKVGQLLMFGFIGGDAPSAGFLNILEQYPVGNMIFYGDNIDRGDGAGGFESVRRQIALLEEQYSCGIPRFFSVDAEGGTVVRFDWQPPLASAYMLGQGGAEAAYEQFERAALQLRSVGVNMDLAPVLDVSPDPLSTFLGTRIISADTDAVIDIGSAVIDGLHAGGCSAVAKHFPGHGATDEDSHDHTPVVNKTREELYAYDLAPYAALAKSVDCVMAAHIKYPALDPDDIASLSYPILTGILREELGFEGVIISDEIRMGGVTSGYTAAEAAVKFVLAGGDILLCSADYPAQVEVISALYSACGDGTISQARLDQSVYRVLYAKYACGIWAP